MSRTCIGLVWVGLVLAPWASAEAAPTADAATPRAVSLQFTTQPGCPSEAEFVGEVLARVRIPLQFGVSEPAIRVVVKLEQTTEGARGELELQHDTAAPTQREFIASSCTEVGSALALVAALTLDPNARTEPLPMRAPSDPEPANVAPEPPPAPTPRPTPPPASKPPPQAAPNVRHHYLGWIGAVAGFGWGEAPKVLGLFGLSLGVRRLGSSPLSPSLQLTPLWGKTGVSGPASPTGEFSWAIGRLEACPASFRLASLSRLDPCAAAELGQLSARSVDSAVAVPGAAERWWAAAGATLSLHVDLGDRFFVRLGGVALFPVTRDEFVFDEPVRRVHRARAISLGGQLGIGFQLGQ